MKTENNTEEFSPEDLNLITLAREYSDEDKARTLLEKLRWPNGVVCPHCQNDGKQKTISKLTGKPGSKSAVRKGVHFCGACRKQFTVTVKTVMEASHIKISTWVMAWFIVSSSKKSVSALQLSRMLGITYKSAWFLAHRIRYAVSDDKGEKLSGVVEVDETFVGGKGDMKTKILRKTPVVALIEQGGKCKTRVVAGVSHKNLGSVMAECVNQSATICTDEHKGYDIPGKHFAAHHSVNHKKLEYHLVTKDGISAMTNHCESFFSLLKRGVYGAWHNVSREHLQKYSDEFSFRWNTRTLKDGERMATGIPMAEGKRLFYRRPTV